ncbi:hypothetical protein BSKO_12165 [Bryopsis sp. KO-2023]|nr:hypothetical protein BSKO_12165 [Bryopsis sp. KO-2023]
MSSRETAFGFVPRQVVTDLKDIGNWKVRACAIDALHKSLLDVSHKKSILDSLPNFLSFLMTLVADPNFKISLSSMQIIGDLVLKVGKYVEQHIGVVIPKLIEKLGDNKIMVRQASIQVLRNMLKVTSPRPVLEMLVEGLKHSSWRIREEVVTIHIMVMLTADKDRINFVDMAAVFVESFNDPKDRVRTIALGGLGVIDSKLGRADCLDLMNLAGGTPEMRKALDELCKTARLPFISREGFVEYEALSSGKESFAESPSRSGSMHSKGKIPWEIPAPRGHSRNGPTAQSRGQVTGDFGIAKHLLSAPKIEGHKSPNRSNKGNTMCEDLLQVPTTQKPVQGQSKIAKQGTETGLNLVERLNRMLQFEDSLDAHTKYNHPRSIQGNVNQWMPEGTPSPTSPSGKGQRSAIQQLDRLLKARESGSIDSCCSLDSILDESVIVSGFPRDESSNSRLATWSPSKEERLEKLKRRQQESRRVHSASAVLQRPNLLDSEIGGPGASPSARVSQTQQQSRDSISGAPTVNILAGARWSQNGYTDDLDSTPEHSNSRITHSKARHRRSGSPLSLDVNWNEGSSMHGRVCRQDTVCSGSDSFEQSPTTPFGSRGGSRTTSFFMDKGKGVEELSFEELTPCIDPEATMRSVLQRLSCANHAKRKELNWQDQNDALNDARRLIGHHPDVVRCFLHEFVLSALPAVDQLRSSTSKNALILFQEMFRSLGRLLDRELEEIIPTLLKKSAEVSNAGRDSFLASEADKALNLMVQHVSELKAISTLVSLANHKSPHFRARVAANLDDCLETVSSRLSASGHVGLIEKVFKAAVGFLEEGSLETRTRGKRIIWDIKHWLNSRSSFGRLVEQLGSETKKRKVSEVVESSNGPPPPPVKPVARSQGSRQLASQGSFSPLTPSITPPSRTSLCSSGVESYDQRSPGQSSTSETRHHRLLRKGSSESSETGSHRSSCRPPPRPPIAPNCSRTVSQDIEDVEASGKLQDALNLISSKDWRERMVCLKTIGSITSRLTNVPEIMLLSCMDQITHRLSDGNSKVIVSALETLTSLFGGLGDRLAFSLNTLVPALASNLGSTNEKIRFSASNAIDQLMSAVDHVLLIQVLWVDSN